MPARRHRWGIARRMLVGAALAVLIAGGTAGLAIDLHDTQSRTRLDAERSARERASLASALIDSVFGATFAGDQSTDAAISKATVTPQDIRAALGLTPLAAVVASDHRLLASTPPLPASVAYQIAHDPSVGHALAGEPNALSNLYPPIGRIPSGFLESSGYQTPYGRRVQVTWFPLQAVTGILQQYLGFVAHYARARVYLVDGHGTVIGSSSPTVRLGAPVPDRALATAILRGPESGHYAGGSVFYAFSRLHVAPWSVVYTVPSSVLYGSTGYSPTLSYLLLSGFALGALLSLILLMRLVRQSADLAAVNAALERRNAEVEQANQAKSRFLANMSHELRTPLNAIIGFADLMYDGRLGAVSEQHREYLGDIRSSARHLLHLINEVLDLARVESGRIMLDPQPTDPTAVAAECVDSLRSLAAERQIEVRLEATPVPGAILDAARLRQVILNYLSNALKFTPAGGTVWVRVRRDADELVIEVADTGPGIAPADRVRVFGEFEQLGRHSHGGTGLGLAVTRRIVEAQGGRVGVGDTPGRGAVFYARLPLRTAASAPADAATAKPGAEQVQVAAL